MALSRAWSSVLTEPPQTGALLTTGDRKVWNWLAGRDIADISMELTVVAEARPLMAPSTALSQMLPVRTPRFSVRVLTRVVSSAMNCGRLLVPRSSSLGGVWSVLQIWRRCRCPPGLAGSWCCRKGGWLLPAEWWCWPRTRWWCPGDG